jgi:hypothetical protein
VPLTIPFLGDVEGFSHGCRSSAMLHRLRLLEFLTPKRVRLKLCKTLVLPSYEKNQQLLLDFDALSLNLFLDFSQHTRFLS